MLSFEGKLLRVVVKCKKHRGTTLVSCVTPGKHLNHSEPQFPSSEKQE